MTRIPEVFAYTALGLSAIPHPSAAGAEAGASPGIGEPDSRYDSDRSR